MQTIGFQVTAENGTISIPEKFASELNEQTLYVTISVQKKSPAKSYLRELIDNPISLPKFKPLTRDEIYEREK